jgi:hypothetical protein
LLFALRDFVDFFKEAGCKEAGCSASGTLTNVLSEALKTSRRGREPVRLGVCVRASTFHPKMIGAFTDRLFKILHHHLS